MTDPLVVEDDREIACKRLREDAQLPQRSNAGDAGFDLSACIDSQIRLSPGQRATVPTGIALEMPNDIAGLVLSRSGLASKHGVFVLNAPGLVDPNYRGEIKVVLQNLGETEILITSGTRIAQILFTTVVHWTGWPFSIREVDRDLVSTARGDNGFGSTGI